MITISKVFSNIWIFTPIENDMYNVHQNGREVEQKGMKIAVFSKFRSKFPSLLKALSDLMYQNEVFFYDPVFNSFRVVNKEKTLDEAINYYYKVIAPIMQMKNAHSKLEKNIDKIEVNPYISMYGIDNNWLPETIQFSE